MDKNAKRLVIAASCVAIMSGLSIFSLVVVFIIPNVADRFWGSEIKSSRQLPGCRTLSYSTFLEKVKAERVSRLVIFPDQGMAEVVENDGGCSTVQLLPDKNLLRLLIDNDVDISVEPSR